MGGPDDVHIFSVSVAQSVGHRGGALQCHAVGASIGGERGRSDGDRQRGALRYLLQDVEADDADLRRPQPFGVGSNQRHYVLPAIPGSVEQRFEEIGGELGAVPATPFLYDGIRAVDLSRLSAVPSTDGARTDSQVIGFIIIWACYSADD